MMIHPTIAELAKLMEAALPPMTDEHRRLARTLTRALGEGRPVDIARLADAFGRPEPEVAEAVAELPFVYRDDEQRVTGFAGLAVADLAKTPHRLGLAGRELYAWCAWDTLFLPIVLDREARVHSTCPTTGERITLTVSPAGFADLHPSGAAMSFLLPGEDGLSGDVIRGYCHFVHFFASEEAARTWVGEHEGTFQISIEDAFELARFWAASLFGVRPAVEARV